eukprot:13791613-Alexandrium_andersonii.AAC.1
MELSRSISFWRSVSISDLRPSALAGCWAWKLWMLWHSPEQEAKRASTADRVSLTELPWAWNSARA